MNPEGAKLVFALLHSYNQLPMPSPRELIDEIASAFNGVERDNGTTWREGEELDNRGTPEELAAARLRDTDRRWQDVPHQLFEKYSSPVTFLDDKGFRYYLPAIMTWSLSPDRRSEAATDDNLLDNLNRADRQRFLQQILTPAQLRATARWVFHATDTWFEPDKGWTAQLRSFWNQYREP